MRPLILISNDDGITASGLRYLVDSVIDMADVIVVAPQTPHSGQSAAITVGDPLKIIEHPDYHGALMRSVTGTPVDCVKLAMHHILPRRPDLMLAGVNHGSNAGNSVIYSGTMGAVFEASMQGIPAIGYSLLSHAEDADFSQCGPYIMEITRKVLEKGLPYQVCLNVNFPAKVEILGIKTVCAAQSHWTEEYTRYVDPHGHPFFMLSGSIVNDEPDRRDTDLYWLDRQHGTVVPTYVDRNAPSEIPAINSLLGLKPADR